MTKANSIGLNVYLDPDLDLCVGGPPCVACDSRYGMMHEDLGGCDGVDVMTFSDLPLQLHDEFYALDYDTCHLDMKNACLSDIQEHDAWFRILPEPNMTLDDKLGGECPFASKTEEQFFTDDSSPESLPLAADVTQETYDAGSYLDLPLFPDAFVGDVREPAVCVAKKRKNRHSNVRYIEEDPSYRAKKRPTKNGAALIGHVGASSQVHGADNLQQDDSSSTAPEDSLKKGQNLAPLTLIDQCPGIQRPPASALLLPIEDIQNIYKSKSKLCVAGLRRCMRVVPGVALVSAETPVIMAKVCELFLQEACHAARRHATSEEVTAADFVEGLQNHTSFKVHLWKK